MKMVFRRRFPGTVLLCLSLALMGGLRCVSHVAAEDEPIAGLEIGKAAPSFQLKDQQGADRSLKDLLKRGNVALVFYRSADW